MRVADDAIWQEVEGQVVLLLLADNSYFRLDSVGSSVWAALVENGSLDAAITALIGAYDVEDEVLRADVMRLAAELVDAGLLETDSAG